LVETLRDILHLLSLLEKWFLWQIFSTAPVTIITWIVLAGCVQLLANPFNGKGTFEDNLAGLALPLIILIPSMFVPNVIVDFVLPEEIIHFPVF